MHMNNINTKYKAIRKNTNTIRKRVETVWAVISVAGSYCRADRIDYFRGIFFLQRYFLITHLLRCKTST